MMQKDGVEAEVKTGDYLLSENRKLSDPQIKILVELLRHGDPLLKAELNDAEFEPYVRASSFADILDLPLHKKVIENFLRSKMAYKRKRVEEILQVLSPGYKPKKKGFFARLFGGGD